MSAPELLTLRIGSRFLIVTLFPNLGFTVLIGILVVAGAPADRPAWHRVDERLQHLSLGGMILLALAVLAASVALHPLNYALIQVMEGYWTGLPFGAALQEAAAERGAQYRQALLARAGTDGNAAAALYWLPEGPHPVRPTTLGNVLFAGEVRAGSRYGYRTEIVWPRLVPLLSERMRAQLGDARNQLDAAARLCGLGLLAVPITTALLIRYDVWLIVPIGCYLFSWTSYRSAITAARRFSNGLGVAFDMHHLALWDALSLDRPTHLQEEYSKRGDQLTRLFLQEDELEPYERESFVYLPPPSPSPWPTPPP
jgi:hypothetical protein